jgi:hypothetical protein
MLFLLDVPMVISPKFSFVANSNNPTGVGLTLSETIRFASLEFTVDRLGRLSLSPEEGDSGAIFIGMVHSGLPSLHTALKNSSDEGGTALGARGSSGSPGPRECNVVILIVPIPTTPALENTFILLTIPTVTVWTTAPQPSMELLPD